ncbi:MAG: GDP-mannose 4,6-dehydratase [Candidatus Levyibacteriota bacterium]
MKKVLITGITGFVGQHLAHHLLSQNTYEIIGTYRSENSLDSLGELKDKIAFKNVDLNDTDAVGELILSQKPDAIFHLAAQASPAQSFKSPIQTLTNNIVSELSILEAIKSNNFKDTRVVIISTSEIYGMVTQADIPVDEETPLRPASPYAVSKIAQDYLSLQYHLSYKLDIVRLRPFNHIGPGQKVGYVVADFAKQVIEIEKDKKEPVLSVGNLNAKRDFTDVRDMVKAYTLALEKGKSGEAYNLGSGTSHKIADILDQLLAGSAKKIEVKVDPERFRPVDVPEIVCDTTKFKSLTGWEPEISFETTLKDTLDYWRKIV